MGKKIPSLKKVAFGFGDFGNSTAQTIIDFFLLYYITDVVRISPGIGGTILFISRIWDAVIDPFIGNRSDKLKTRFGRRRPFFITFSFPFAIFFFLLWSVPQFSYSFKILYVFLVFLIFVTFFSLIQIPYASLIPQMTDDYHERTSLTGYRMFFNIIGGLVGAAIPLEIVKMFKNEHTGFMVMGGIFALIILLSPLIVFFSVKEEKIEEKKEEIPFLKGVKEVFKNKPFIPAILMFLFSWMAVSIITVVMIYYIKYWLGIKEQASIILGIIFISAALFIPFWYFISRKIGKRGAYIAGALLMIVVLFSIIFLPRSDRLWIYILACFGGAGISSIHIIPWAILPDVIEYDEMKTGKRREGLYSGFSSFLRQLSSSGALFLTGITLQLVNYKPDVEQTKQSLMAIKVLLGPIPSFIFLLGIISILFYPLTMKKHNKIKSILYKKRKKYGD